MEQGPQFDDSGFGAQHNYTRYIRENDIDPYSQEAIDLCPQCQRDKAGPPPGFDIKKHGWAQVSHEPWTKRCRDIGRTHCTCDSCY